MLFSPHLGQTVSNNSEHLGSLQALHPSPWGSSPGTGGPTQLPFLLESCLEHRDYRSSPRRDVSPGILSKSFTLIIRKEWQCGKNTDTYHQCTKKKKKASQCQKVNFLKVRVKIKWSLLFVQFPWLAGWEHDMTYEKNLFEQTWLFHGKMASRQICRPQWIFFKCFSYNCCMGKYHNKESKVCTRRSACALVFMKFLC